jgi:hypothetical protein
MEACMIDENTPKIFFFGGKDDRLPILQLDAFRWQFTYTDARSLQILQDADGSLRFSRCMTDKIEPFNEFFVRAMGKIETCDIHASERKMLDHSL